VLAVEVAESSLRFDRGRKGGIYARAGLQDYWIVNLIDRVLEVYRDPTADQAARFGWRYGSVVTLTPPADVVPLAFPSITIAVADLFP
jgi:Uma2 family endonuclease